ncbi:GtrA family protein [Amnibacterium endophyticum]|uniref:GtrA family protein n=1 Tax=Amnibacterium endophyticum TaxID=2109337 RepID=A0ABW4LHX2_9MICO
MPTRLILLLRRVLSFAAGSSAGLVIDLGGFLALHAAGVVPWLANAISSSAAVTAVYLLVTRYAFGANRRIRTYVAFVAWYASVIVALSAVIQLLTTATGVDPFVWKLLSIPVTFTANFLFSQLLFRGRPSRASIGPRP